MVFKTSGELHHFESEYIIYNQIDLQPYIETPPNSPRIHMSLKCTCKFSNIEHKFCHKMWDFHKFRIIEIIQIMSYGCKRIRSKSKSEINWEIPEDVKN